MKYFAVKGYRDFQHYSERNPPWIKLYYRLIGDLDFKRLTEVQQIHLVLIWLIASRLDNRIPYDEAYVRAAIGAKRRVDLKALVDSGFLLMVEDTPGASNGKGPGASTKVSPGASADASTRSMPPHTREEATEATEHSPSLSLDARAAEAALAALLPTDADRNALTAVMLAASKHARAWLAEMQACLDGMGGHVHATPAQLGEALRDYVANGAHEFKNMRQFRRYLRSAAESGEDPGSSAVSSGRRPPPRPRGGVAARTFANGMEALKDL